MKGLNRIAIGVGLLLALGVTAYAQQPPAAGGGGGARQGRGGGRGGVTLATAPISVIHAVVTLTDDEKTKITKIQDDYKAAAKTAAGDRTAMTAARTKANEDALGVLTSDQKTKWTETAPAVGLLNQSKVIPYAALADVKLTDEQWTKIKAAATDYNTKLQAVARADRQTEGPKLLADFKTAAEAVLTADQKTIIEKTPKPAAPAVL
jgi:Spy/CpxP family protein refolding chaperone